MSGYGSLMRRVLRRGAFWVSVGWGLLAVILFLSLLSVVWTPHDIRVVRIGERFQGSDWVYLLGTDHLGRDILSLLMAGGRHSMTVSFLSWGIGFFIGVPLGLASAVLGGSMGRILSRLGEVIFAFPALITAAVFSASWGSGLSSAVWAIGIFNATVFLRMTRSTALALYSETFVESARAIGRNEWSIAVRHILPNMGHILAVQSTVQLSVAIIIEATLSYLGFSVSPGQPSWGRMLQDAQTFVELAPHTAIYPGLAIFLTVSALSLVARPAGFRRGRLLKSVSGESPGASSLGIEKASLALHRETR